MGRRTMSFSAAGGDLRQRATAPARGSALDGAHVPLMPSFDDDASAKRHKPVAAGAQSAYVPPVRVLGGLLTVPAATLERISLVALTVLAFVTRFLWLGWSDKVVWDEAHFGKFAGYYIKREFYFDVHPPLGKTLLGLAGLMAGFDGQFDFESGKEYPANVNYAFMRAFCALFGALMVPLAYLTARELRFSHWAAFAAASMVLFDNAFTVISRFILLDSLLLFGTVVSLYTWAKYTNLRDQAFSPEWWTWLFLTGCALGFVSSVKWVGFFIVALVGLHTLEDLWDLWGDVSMPKAKYAMHWVARAVCLIAVPVAIYIFSFAMHFAILTRSGPGDAQMSSLFQANLEGTNIVKSPLNLMYGSKFTLKNNGYGGGLLHSHVQTYPAGSKQQQVTCYHHKDDNNNWIISKTREEEIDAPPKVQDEPEKLEPVRHGDVVRLIHEQTGRNLHSHAVAGPVTKTMNEVSCYGNKTLGDANDYWVVELVDDIKRKGVRGAELDGVHTLTTRMRLRHKGTGCLLRSHNVNLPKWGFTQAEVVCDKRKDKKAEEDVYNIWNVENLWDDRQPIADASHYKTSFFKDFIHLNVAMWTSNNALVPDPDKEPDQLTSQPRQWPLMQVGIRMASWGDDDVKFYMLGNPIVWWLAIASLGAWVGLWLLYQVLFKRRLTQPRWSPENPEYERFMFAGKWLALGWLLHYAPFGLMGRVTYLHHYFPALYFTVLLAAFVLDHMTLRAPGAVRDGMWIGVMIAIVATFMHFAGMTFGFKVPASEWGPSRSWVSTWKIMN